MEKLDQKIKGPLKGKSTKELVRKIKKETYVDIKTEDKPKGKVRGKIKKLTPVDMYIFTILLLKIYWFR